MEVPIKRMKVGENLTKKVPLEDIFKPGDSEEADLLSLIFKKLSVLEEKIDKVAYRTKTHWVH